MRHLDIATFLHRKRMKQRELAKSLDVSLGFIGQLAVGKSKVSYDNLLKLIELGATLEELFGVEYSQKVLKNSAQSQENDVLNKIEELKNRIEDLEIKNQFQQVAVQKPTTVTQVG